MQVSFKIRPMLVAMALAASLIPVTMDSPPATAQVDPHVKRIYGLLLGVDLSAMTMSLERRNGKILTLDLSQALSLQQIGILPLNQAVVVWGVRGPNKVFHVQSVGHSPPRKRDWGTDEDNG